jgi:Zn-dependent peptidase ImmA (M78 family)
MDQFTVTNDKIIHISRQFNVEENTVESVFQMFTRVITGVKYQYLAHVIRTMEVYIREKTKNPMFQINCQPLDAASPLLNIGCAHYYPGQYFTIYFHPRMNERQLRVCLAHELGHLFIIEMANERLADDSPPYTQDTLTEPLSSIFGVFTILDKNHFYQERGKPFNHGTWEDIVEDFIHLRDKAGSSSDKT